MNNPDSLIRNSYLTIVHPGQPTFFEREILHQSEADWLSLLTKVDTLYTLARHQGSPPGHQGSVTGHCTGRWLRSFFFYCVSTLTQSSRAPGAELPRHFSGRLLFRGVLVLRKKPHTLLNCHIPTQNHNVIAGQINYFDWAIFNIYSYFCH